MKSIQDFPKMLELRPIIVDDDMVVLGGNMRLKALKELKYEEVPIIKANELTEEQKREFIIKDNVGYGEWDWDMLANEWDNELLNEWGVDIPEWNNEESNKKEASKNIEMEYQILINCTDEQEQEEVFEKISSLGLSCEIKIL